MPTTGDLININNLTLSDTFNTWLDRTNQVIDYLNPLQVYDVNVGQTGGLLKLTGLSSGNYNGVVTLYVNPGPGIGTKDLSGANRTVVDFALFDPYGLVLTGGASGSVSSVASNDEIMVNDVSDSGGTVKKVSARNMLPPVIDTPTLTINGNLIVNGSFNQFGSSSYIAGNNLRIEDKLIELAYQQAIKLQITGATSGSVTSFINAVNSAGATAYHFANSTTTVADIIGKIQAYTGPAAGPTGTFFFGSPFEDLGNAFNGPEDLIGVTGFVSLSPTGSTRFLVNVTPTAGDITTSFLSDNLLNEAGIYIYGASGDKEFAWWNKDPKDDVTFRNAFLANTNLGVEKDSSTVISKHYHSYGFSGNSADFVFSSLSGQSSVGIYFAHRPVQSDQDWTQYTASNSWSIVKNNTSNILSFNYSSTGQNLGTNLFNIYPSASGQTFSGVPVTNFAEKLNSDLLDGAHASLTSAAYTIPIADVSGRISGSWVSADSIRKTINQTGHGFTTIGTPVRINSSGNYVSARANTEQNAEVLGLISSVPDANNFEVTYKGIISGLSGPALLTDVPLSATTDFIPGEVYFLSSSSSGKMVANQSFLPEGSVIKPLFLANSKTSGFVLNYIGATKPEPTDSVYLTGLVPVGTIIPFGGNNLSSLLVENGGSWILCNGKKYTRAGNEDLFDAIGNETYYAAGTSTNTTIISIEGGSVKGLSIGDQVKVVLSDNSIINASITAIANNNITLDNTTPLVINESVKVYAKKNSLNEDIFFVPDLRTRVTLGGTTGSSYYENTSLTKLSLGDVGGSETITLTAGNLPSHSHGMGVVSVASGSFQAAFGPGSSTNTGTVGNGTPVNNLQPYITVNYIIRAKTTVQATIITGHNHDNRYISYTTDFSGTLTAGDYQTFFNNAGVYGTAQSDSRFVNTTGDTMTGMLSIDSRFRVLSSTSQPNSYPPVENGQFVSYKNSNGEILIAESLTSPSGEQSKNRVSIFGDVVVHGSGISGASGLTPHNSEVFAVDTHLSRVTIKGGFTAGISGGTQFTSSNPILAFIGPNDASSPALGRITGLATPVNGSDAVNKDYVDNNFGRTFVKYMNFPVLNQWIRFSDQRLNLPANTKSLRFYLAGVSDSYRDVYIRYSIRPVSQPNNIIINERLVFYTVCASPLTVTSMVDIKSVLAYGINDETEILIEVFGAGTNYVVLHEYET